MEQNNCKVRGFTLVELLIVIAIIGIIAAIAIPNLITALQKAKQKVTMGDMKSIGTAIESYITDVFFVPNVTADQLASVLSPFHIRKMPLYDGWGFRWRYQHGTPGGAAADIYSIGSGGRDGIIDWSITGGYQVTNHLAFDFDIIYSIGQFTRFPHLK